MATITEKKNIAVNISIHPDILKQLDGQAKALGMSRSEYISQCVRIFNFLAGDASLNRAIGRAMSSVVRKFKK